MNYHKWMAAKANNAVKFHVKIQKISVYTSMDAEVIKTEILAMSACSACSIDDCTDLVLERAGQGMNEDTGLFR